MPDDDGAPPDDRFGNPDSPVAPADGAAELPPDADQPPATPVADGADVATRLGEVEAALSALAHRIEADSERAAARERVIDRQHADIERLRTVERVGVLRPVVTDLCRLRNDLLRQATTLPAHVPAQRVADLLESFAASVEESLLRCGVEVQPREVGGRFAPGRQQVAKVVEVDDPDRDGTVAEVVQDGYAEVNGGAVVAPARVVVHRATATQTTATRTTATRTTPTETKEHADA